MLKKYEFVKQEGIKDCGVCSLLMIIKYYNGNISLESLRNLTNTTKNGVDAYSLLNTAKNLGFSAQGVSCNIDALTDKYLPCIAHTIINKSYKHFVVIYDIDFYKKIIIIADPADKIKKMSFDDFRNISTNNFLLLKPTKPICNFKTSKSFVNLIIDFLFKNKSFLLSIFLYSIIFTVLNIFTAYNFKFIIDLAINYNSNDNLYIITFMIILIVILREIVNYFKDYLVIYVNHLLDSTLFTSIYKHIISLPYLYYKNRTTGEIISRMNDSNSIKEFLSKILLFCSSDLLLFILVFFILISISKILTLIISITLLLYIFISSVYNLILEKYIEKVYSSASNANSYLIESFNAIESIKNLGVENINYDNFNIKYNKYLNNKFSYSKITNSLDKIKSSINSIGLCIIFFIGGLLVIKNKITLSDLVIYQGLIFYFINPVNNFMDLLLLYRNNRVIIKRILELYQVESEKLLYDNKTLNNINITNVLVNNLNYSYNQKDNVLNNINLNIKLGEKIVLYGDSGGGKSTLIKILLKYIEINRGMVYFNEIDINDYNLLQLRNNICYISQHEHLFTDSIINNIIMNRNITYKEFLEVAEITMVDEVVKNDVVGYDKLLEEDGNNLSGGERQRIILARGLLKKSSIYIFDEILNEVDIKRERIILKSIFSKLKDKTIIIISHRFNNIDLFDRKIHLINGAINYG